MPCVLFVPFLRITRFTAACPIGQAFDTFITSTTWLSSAAAAKASQMVENTALTSPDTVLLMFPGCTVKPAAFSVPRNRPMACPRSSVRNG